MLNGASLQAGGLDAKLAVTMNEETPGVGLYLDCGLKCGSGRLCLQLRPPGSWAFSYVCTMDATCWARNPPRIQLSMRM